MSAKQPHGTLAVACRGSGIAHVAHNDLDSIDFQDKKNAFSWLSRILAATLVFNFCDIVMTLLVVISGIGVEANPLMAYLLEQSPLAFALFKVTMVSIGVMVLWHTRHYRLAIAGSVGIFSVYAMLMLYHSISVKLVLMRYATLI